MQRLRIAKLSEILEHTTYTLRTLQEDPLGLVRLGQALAGALHLRSSKLKQPIRVSFSICICKAYGSLGLSGITRMVS